MSKLGIKHRTRSLGGPLKASPPSEQDSYQLLACRQGPRRSAVQQASAEIPAEGHHTHPGPTERRVCKTRRFYKRAQTQAPGALSWISVPACWNAELCLRLSAAQLGSRRILLGHDLYWACVLAQQTHKMITGHNKPGSRQVRDGEKRELEEMPR